MRAILERLSLLPTRFFAAMTLGVMLLGILRETIWSDMSRQTLILLYAAIAIVSLAVGLYLSLFRETQYERILRARKIYRDGCKVFDEGDYSRAEEYFREATDLDPDDFFYKNRYGRAALRQGHYHAAYLTFSDARELAPSKENYRATTKNRALAATCARDYAGAVKDYEEYLHLKPRDVGALRLKALAWLGLGDVNQALVDAREAWREKPRASTSHSTLAAVLSAQGKYEDAGRELEEARRLNHGNADAYYALAQALAALGRQDESAEALIVAARRDSKFRPRADTDRLLETVTAREDVRRVLDEPGPGTDEQADSSLA